MPSYFCQQQKILAYINVFYFIPVNLPSNRYIPFGKWLVYETHILFHPIYKNSWTETDIHRTSRVEVCLTSQWSRCSDVQNRGASPTPIYHLQISLPTIHCQSGSAPYPCQVVINMQVKNKVKCSGPPSTVKCD